MDTIFAVATASGRAGVSIVRISGDRAVTGLVGLIPDLDEDRRRPQVRAIYDLEHRLIDEPMILVFHEGQSFTGEQTVELHLHGSPAIIKAVLRLLANIDGFRMAEPGEFTRRALINDRMSLDEVQGLGDLIDAETEIQLAQARKLLDGELKKRAERWRASLIHAGALLQATIDFADEDVPTNVFPEVRKILSELKDELYNEYKGLEVSEKIRDGFEIAILGTPNAGKSTLLNYLSRRDVAIVSEVAGTTRDVIEVRMDLFGYPVSFLDTAGLRASDDIVESIGIRRAEERAEKADLRIWIKASPDEQPVFEMQDFDLVLLGKDDAGREKLGVSGNTGAGVDVLLDKIKDVLDQRAATVGAATLDRHGIAIERTLKIIETAMVGLDTDKADELVAEDIRLAAFELDALIGRVDVEDVLDKVFSSFCLGK